MLFVKRSKSVPVGHAVCAIVTDNFLPRSFDSRIELNRVVDDDSSVSPEPDRDSVSA
jgi:hypothetical protein